MTQPARPGTPCTGQHVGCPTCMAYYLTHHANTCTYARQQDPMPNDTWAYTDERIGKDHILEVMALLNLTGTSTHPKADRDP